MSTRAGRKRSASKPAARANGTVAPVAKAEKPLSAAERRRLIDKFLREDIERWRAAWEELAKR